MKLKEVMTSMDYEKLYKAYYLHNVINLKAEDIYSEMD